MSFAESSRTDDGSLMISVAENLLTESPWRFRHVGIAVSNGSVRLVGHVRDYDCKQLAQEVACRAPGVHSILNELRVVAVASEAHA